MRIGCGRSNLEFPKDFFPTEGFVKQVHPLYVRAMLLGSDNPFVLVSIEMTSLPGEEVNLLRKAAATCGGTAIGRVWITVTHTFSAPHILPDELLTTDRNRKNKNALRTMLLNAVCHAVEEARQQACDQTLSLRQGQSALVASRDIELSEGWWVGCGGSGPADKTLTVIEASAETQTKALLVHLNIQSSVLDGTGAANGKCVSGDLAGICCGILEHQYAGAVVLFLIGAAGDMAPVERAKGFVPDGKNGYHEIDLHEQGVPLAEEVRSLMAQKRIPLNGEIKTAETPVTVAQKKMNRNLHELKPTRSCAWEPDGESEQPISLLALGGLAIIGVKPELTYHTDRLVKAESPFPYTLLMTLVNGGAKYMAAMDAYERCMYEAINSPFAPGAAEQLAHAALTLLTKDQA